MRTHAILVVCLTVAGVTVAAPVREPGEPCDITAPIVDSGERGERDWAEVYRDDVESLSLGFLDGQVNALGEEWSSFDAVVTSSVQNQFISQTNTYADDYFFAEVGTTLPATEGPFVFSVESELNDWDTSRFYTPVDNVIGQIFTRVGDSDNDGQWEVLQLDVNGDPYFAETGWDIPLLFELEIRVAGSDMEVAVNGNSIFTGDVIDSGTSGAGLSSTLTGAYFESGNESGGADSWATYDEVKIAVPEAPTLVFMLIGAGLATGLVVVKRFA